MTATAAIIVSTDLQASSTWPDQMPSLSFICQEMLTATQPDMPSILPISQATLLILNQPAEFTDTLLTLPLEALPL